MILKPLIDSVDFSLMQYLNKRLIMPPQKKQYLENLTKGAEGERHWEGWLNQLSNESIILYDLTLEYKHTIFQIDALCIFQKTIIAFEVKNYEGDFYINGDIWSSASGSEIKNPLLQVQRSESLLRPLLKTLNIQLPIEYYLVFVHPDFMLYQAPPHKKMIFPQQINRYIRHLNNIPSKMSRAHRDIAEHFIY
ncbi:nuclease-related domain-containing protein [Cytobacillus purgationiresistens]|uniref:NERD domain-containing protein n=1 Tax=Cytobacillus purgationiresistens TaxID=863449 RepID=A0ABU0AH42_9BACI|nr:nuclease-related domain-containing protein [Cytobacillus purgationiresistens]MDQ0270557.1 hypothetical protein [Cytobacillus purgationiresistens]